MVPRLLTLAFFHYARVRTWMERAPRQERWPWYGWFAIWLFVATEIIFA